MQVRMMKFRLYPNKIQTQKLDETLEDCRYVYNTLFSKEKKELTDAAKAIYQTYKTTIEVIEKNSTCK